MGHIPAAFERAQHARLVIVTGLSGSGKGTMLRALEDAGYYTVDNLPVELMRPFAESGPLSDSSVRAALVVDIRDRQGLDRFPRVYREIRASVPAVLTFLEASDSVLQHRFSETRRPHPAGMPTVAQSIPAERELLAPIRTLADIEIDTSHFNVHDLRRRVLEIFRGPGEGTDLRVTIGSFGFKYGPPVDADVVFDVRFLPNPHYEPELRGLTGADSEIARFLEGYPETHEFIDRVMSLLEFVVPRYGAEGKSYISIYLGCTGGRHRSVYIAEAVARLLGDLGRPARVQHRDIDKDG